MNSTPIPDGTPVGAGTPSEQSARRVSSGFGNPAEDSTVRRIDLNEALIRHAEATYVMRAAGTAMQGAGVDAGDVLLVDRAVIPSNGNLVVAAVEGELVVRRLTTNGMHTLLQAADDSVRDIVVDNKTGIDVWGVITYVIKSVI